MPSRFDFLFDRTEPATRSARFDLERPFLFDELQPRFATHTVRSCFIPMRDGTRLSTDLHFPVGAQLPLPLILQRGPYGKGRSSWALEALFPEQGFVYATQDVRGRYESEGEFVACSSVDRADGYDTVTWLASQPWSNGKVGTIGSSYSGETAAKLSAMRHPAHRCGIIMFDGAYGGGDVKNGAYLQGGVTLLKMMFEWFRDHVPKYSYGPPSFIDREQWFAQIGSQSYSTQPVAQPPVDVDAQLRTLPVFDMLDRCGSAPSEFSEMMRLADEPAHTYWADQGFLTDQDRFDTPTIHVTGPLERGGSGFENVRLFKSNAESQLAGEHQYLWFTPAAHSQYQLCKEDSRFGERWFGDTRFPYYSTIISWFGHWLREDSLDLDQWPKVRYFLANANEWRTAPTWPPSDVEERTLYLHSSGNARGQIDDGVLAWTPPAVDQNSDTFQYDPMNPVPSELPGSELDALGGGYCDRSILQQRADVLVYTTLPLETDLELAGPVRARLFVSSSAKDTDFTAMLCEVDPSGRSLNVTNGIARCRYREGLDRRAWMQTGETYLIEIDLWHAAVKLPRGHRIRLEISSSHFPFFDRNLNTAENNHTGTTAEVAQNTVHHDCARPSSLIVYARESMPT